MISFLAIALISAATLVLELGLLRIFAVQQFYHFAFMAVSLALLGAGASGSLLSVGRGRLSPVLLAFFFSLSAVTAYLIINNVPFDSFSIAWDSRQLVYLAVYFLAAAVPFLFAGLLIGGELMAAGEVGGRGSHKVYSANLIGSACGSLGSLLVLARFGGPGSVLFSAGFGVSAALLFTYSHRNQRMKKRSPRQILVLIFLMLTIIWMLVFPPSFLEQQLSPYKTLSVLEQALDTKHMLSMSDATARLDVLESSVIHVMPGLSLFSPVSIPRQAGLLIDGDNLMPITEILPDSEQAQELANYLPQALPYRLRPDGNVLIINASSGQDVLLALASGVADVTAVEENEHVIEIVRDEFGAATGDLYNDERVTLINEAGRVYSRKNLSEEFDLAVIALNGQHRPVQSGAYSLSEDYSTTTEAVEDYLKVLSADGLLVVTRWLQTPPSESARAFATVAVALINSGRDPAQHLIAFRTLRTMTILAAAKPFTPIELDVARTFLNERGFDAVYLPDLKEEELNRFNVLPKASYHDLFSQILQQPEELLDSYQYDIRPSTDDHPFFFHFFRWRQTPEIVAGLGKSWQPFGGSGFFVLVALLLLVSLAAGVFILGPLLISRRRGDRVDTAIPFWRQRVLIYFAALGLAFLFVEMPLAQQFILILGKPVIALAVVIFAVLLFSGLGSLLSTRIPLSIALVTLVVVAALYPFFLQWLSPFILPWEDWARIVTTVLVLAPLGFLMGLPFASGLRVVERQEASLVPWAWAVNGSFSVISSVLAVMFALTWGFAFVLWLGATAYGVAFFVFRGLGERFHPRPKSYS